MCIRNVVVALSLCFVSRSAPAQITPADLESVRVPDFRVTEPPAFDLSTGFLVPAGTLLPTKVQVLYSARHFPHSRVFRALAFRRYRDLRKLNYGTTLDIAVSLSATSTKPRGMHPTFSLNRGRRVVEVFRGKLVLPYQTPRQTGWHEVKFQRPFFWARSLPATLCVEWDCFASSRGNDVRAIWKEDMVRPDRGGALPRPVTPFCLGPAGSAQFRLTRAYPGVRFEQWLVGPPPNSNLVMALSRSGPGGLWAGRRLPIGIPQSGCVDGIFQIGVPLNFLLARRTDAGGSVKLLDFVVRPPGGYLLYQQVFWLAKNGQLRTPGVHGISIGTGRRADAAMRFSVSKKNPVTGDTFGYGFAPIFRLR